MLRSPNRARPGRLDHSGIAVAFAALAIPQPADGDREREDVGYFGIPARRTEW
jgi:hypothetical protein